MLTGPERQRWVLLEPPTAVARFWSRALPVALLLAASVPLTYPPERTGQRSNGGWVLVCLAALVMVIGGCLLWITASRPREIRDKVQPVLSARTWRENRRLKRALLRREPIGSADRFAAAAHAASEQSALSQAGSTLTGFGFVVLFLADNATGTAAWLVPAIAVTVCTVSLLGAYKAHRLQHAAVRADVAPLVADAPPPSPRVPGSSPHGQR